jgi:hypothetical protein
VIPIVIHIKFCDTFPFPGLPHIYFLFTVRLRIFHVCRNENFRNIYLSFYWKKWFFWQKSIHRFLVKSWKESLQSIIIKSRCLINCPWQLRNDFIFDIWLWHGDLYRVSPFQVYRTSTSCLQCDLEFFMFVIMKTFVTVISTSTGRNDFLSPPTW